AIDAGAVRGRRPGIQAGRGGGALLQHPRVRADDPHCRTEAGTQRRLAGQRASDASVTGNWKQETGNWKLHQWARRWRRADSDWRQVMKSANVVLALLGLTAIPIAAQRVAQPAAIVRI